jgi:hypothetical protein
VGVVKSTIENVHGGLSRGMETGARVQCLGLLVGLSWLLLAVCVLRSRSCSAGFSRLRWKTTLNDWMVISKVGLVLC